MRRKESFYSIYTDAAPEPIGPYSQGIVIRHGPRLREVLISGLIALDPKTGKLVEGGIEEQTERVLENVDASLQAGGARRRDIVYSQVVLTNSDHFADFNKIYASWLDPRRKPPGRSTVIGGIPKPGALVEVSCSAIYRRSIREMFGLKRRRK